MNQAEKDENDEKDLGWEFECLWVILGNFTVALLSVLVLVLVVAWESVWSSRKDSVIKSLPDVVDDVTRALDDHRVQYWVRPGAGLVNGSSSGLDRAEVLHWSPFQAGLDLAIWQKDVRQVLMVLQDLEEKGYESVETYFGMRVYHGSGVEDERVSGRYPFVDLFYFSKIDAQWGATLVVHYCCDCSRIVASSCTKKTCGCLICATKWDDIFPLRRSWVDGVRLALPANLSNVVLSEQFYSVHVKRV